MAGRRDLTIVIADDNCLHRAALKTILKEQGFQVVGEASDGDEAVRLCRNLEPDLAVLDISLPGLTGIDAAREIKKGYPRTGIILLTMHGEAPYILASLRAGAAAYVTKSKAASSLLEAIDAVGRGEIYVRASGSAAP